MGGMLGIWVGLFSAFSFSCSQLAVYITIAVTSVVWSLLFCIEKAEKYRKYCAGGLAVLYIIVALLNIEYPGKGIKDCKNLLIYSANIRYQSEFPVEPMELSGSEMTVFLILVIIGLTFVLGFFSIIKADVLFVLFIEIPIITVIAMLGKEINENAMALMWMHLCQVLAEHIVESKRNYIKDKKNMKCFSSVHKKAILGAGMSVITASVFSFFVFMPLISQKPEPAQQLGAVVEGKAIELLVEYMPAFSGDKKDLKTKTVAGGVADGSLGEESGYSLANLDDLLVTSTIKPTETVYLKGYIGSKYQGDKWEEANEKIFQNASAHWYIEGDASIYIQNLPFLRYLYKESTENKEGEGMGIFTVERINATDTYTFVPYCAYLNDYYQVQGGDGFVEGQTKAEDKFSFYPLEQYLEYMEPSTKDEDSILNHTEASYEAYAKQNYLQVPEGFEELKKQCEEQELKDTEKIIQYVTTFLVSNHRYNIKVSELPEGEDFVKHFLYESKEGYSAHFASAAVIMFRCFKIPARYVTGYAAPESIFSEDEEGNYTALLQSDNSHAWAEIYLSGYGWIPVETTPGNIGVLLTATREDELEAQESADTQEDSQVSEIDSKFENMPPEDREEADYRKKVNGCIFGTLFAGLMLIVLIIVIQRIRREQKKRVYDKKESTNERISSIFSLMYKKMEQAGMPENITSTSEEFRLWLERFLPSLSKKEREGIIALVLESSYGNRAMTEEDVAWMRKIYRKTLVGIRYYKKHRK